MEFAELLRYLEMDVAQLKTASFVTSLQCLLHRLYIIFDFTVNSLYYLFPKGYFNKVISSYCY